jgi:hypothetical protein
MFPLPGSSFPNAVPFARRFDGWHGLCFPGLPQVHVSHGILWPPRLVTDFLWFSVITQISGKPGFTGLIAAVAVFPWFTRLARVCVLLAVRLSSRRRRLRRTR